MAVTSKPETSVENRVAGWLTPEEFSILETVCDTFFPSLEPPDGSSEELAAYYRRSARILNVAHLIAETLAFENEDEQKKFHKLLSLLDSLLGGLMLIGSPRKFKSLSQEKREKYLTVMANSPMGQLRQGYQAIKRLAGFIYFSAPNAQGVNPNWNVLDYTAPSPLPADVPQPIKPLTISEDTILEADAVRKAAIITKLILPYKKLRQCQNSI